MNTFLVLLLFLQIGFFQECVPSSVLERKSQRKLCLNVHTETLILLIKGGSFLRENSDGYGDGKHLNLAQCYLCICAILKSDSFGKLNALLFASSAFICCSSFPRPFLTNVWKHWGCMMSRGWDQCPSFLKDCCSPSKAGLGLEWLGLVSVGWAWLAASLRQACGRWSPWDLGEREWALKGGFNHHSCATGHTQQCWVCQTCEKWL